MSGSLKQKLLGLVFLQTAIAVVVGAEAMWSLGRSSETTKWLASVTAPNIASVGAMNSAKSDMLRFVNAMILERESAVEFAKAKSQAEDALERFRSSNKAYTERPFAEGEQELYESEVAKVWAECEPTLIETVRLLAAGTDVDWNKGIALRASRLKPSINRLDRGLMKLSGFQTDDANRRRIEGEKEAARSNWLQVGMMIVGSFLSIGIGWMTSSRLATSLSELAAQLASGAETVSAGSQEVSGAGANLASSATEQAAAIQETVAAVDQINATVSKNAESAEASSLEARSSEDAANRGQRSMQELVEAIGSIAKGNDAFIQQAARGNEELEKIVAVIHDIEGKTKVINDIVFQTKLLSFNASVEAARAGEHGKGFAVVAEEVGNLAQMSGNAAKEIRELLESSVAQVSEIVNRTKAESGDLSRASRAQVEHGTGIARQCQTILEDIVARSGRTAAVVAEIAVASKEQAKGIQEISRAISELNRSTQINAGASSQASSASEEMARQAEGLQRLAAKLVETVQGKGGRAPAERARVHEGAMESVAEPHAKAA